MSRCQTIGCQGTATHLIVWESEDYRDEPVCGPCARHYSKVLEYQLPDNPYAVHGCSLCFTACRTTCEHREDTR